MYIVMQITQKSKQITQKSKYGCQSKTLKKFTFNLEWIMHANSTSDARYIARATEVNNVNCIILVPDFLNLVLFAEIMLFKHRLNDFKVNISPAISSYTTASSTVSVFSAV